MRILFTVLVLILLLGEFATPQPQSGSGSLQGEWRLRGEGPLVASLKIDKNRAYTFTILPRHKYSGSVKLEGDKDPKHIDFSISDGPYKGKTMQGLYELRDSELILCVGKPDGPRPTEMKDNLKNGITRWKGTQK